MFLIIPNTKEKQPQRRENKPQFVKSEVAQFRAHRHQTGHRNPDRSLWSGVALHSPLEVIGRPGKPEAGFMSGSDPEHSFN